MRLTLFSLILLSITSLILLSCGKNPDEPLVAVPTLKVLSITPTNVKEFQDEVILELEYEDLDGDLGDEDPDEKSLWVKDSRLTEADEYHVKPLAPVGSDVPIKGILNVKLKKVFVLGNANSEQITYTVKIKDREDHWSETDLSPTITVTK